MTALRKRGRRGRGGIAFNHAMIYTSNLPRSLMFYRDILGLKLIDSYPGAYARLRSPTSRTTIALHRVEPGQRMSTKTEGLRLYFEAGNLDAFCRSLRKKRVKFLQMPQLMPWGWRHAYLLDPDGHEISLYWAGKARFERTTIP